MASGYQLGMYIFESNTRAGIGCGLIPAKTLLPAEPDRFRVCLFGLPSASIFWHNHNNTNAYDFMTSPLSTMQPELIPGSSKVNDLDTHSAFSMQELEPSPVDDSASDLENGEHIPKSPRQTPAGALEGEPFISKLGLRAHRWDSWCTFMFLSSNVCRR